MKKFHGKPMSHGQAMADRLVIENLLSACHRLDERSIVGKLAHKRLMEITMEENVRLSINTSLVGEILAERETYRSNIAEAFNAMSLKPKKRSHA